MLDIYTFAFIAFVITLGAFMHGCLGFGFGLITVPPMLMVLPFEIVIPLQIPLSLLLIFPLAWQVRHHVEYTLVAPLLVGALLGLPIGIWILRHLDVHLLRMSVGTILITMSILMLKGWSRPLPNRPYTLIPVGLASATLQGAISISAPPIVLFLANQEMSKDAFRANILLYFSGLGLISLSNFTYQGLYTPEVLHLCAIFLVFIPLGGVTGTLLSRRIPQTIFHTTTLIVSALMGALLFIRSFILLLAA